MTRSAVNDFVCPACRAPLDATPARLHCPVCKADYPIHGGIPRFVGAQNYSKSFGLQWNRHRRTQLDSEIGKPISEKRLHQASGWARDMRGMRVLEAGSGAGRFTEVLCRSGAAVYSFDYSDAVEANALNNAASANLRLFQADLLALPLPQAWFDHVLCLGVLQHTPDPKRSFLSLARHVKPGGDLVIDVYRGVCASRADCRTEHAMGGAGHVRHVRAGVRPSPERRGGAALVRGSRVRHDRGVPWLQRHCRARSAPGSLVMCGLIGATGVGHGADRTRAQAAIARLAERGPDDRGLWSEQETVLAHCRLSILDLSPAGHQPMVSADGRYVLIYNGEIYNFRELRAELGGTWRSDSDSEVILEAYARWGKSFLQRLRGMFALSRPQALFAYDPTLSTAIDPAGLSLYLEAGYFPAPFTLYSAVRKLPGGHLLEFADGKTSISAYWNPLGIEPVAAWRDRPERDLLDELDALLTASVKARLISDVPLGAFLSGGIDSSIVVALMSKLASGPVKTFTIGFREPQYDESQHAAAVARAFGTEHRQEILSVDDLLALVPSFHEHFDEPFFDSSAFPALAVSRLARREVTVALGGDGGDELFGGYHYYSILHRVAPAFRMPQVLREGAAQMIRLAPSHRAQLLAETLSEDEPMKAFRFMRSIAKDFGNLMLEPRAKLDEVFAAAVAQMPRGLTPAEQAMRLDLTHILPEEYLQKTDLSSMSYSLEAREPLLDHELVEWSLKLPLEWKLRGGTGKYLLRRLAERYLPREIVERPKQGFSVPIDRWLRGPLRAWARERLEDRRLYERFPLDRARVLQLLDLHLSGKRDTHPLLWAVLMLSPFA